MRTGEGEEGEQTEAAGGTEPARRRGVDGEDATGAGDGELETIGIGADITGLKNGLSRSTDTVQGFPARDMTKVFSPLSSTAKGPV